MSSEAPVADLRNNPNFIRVFDDSGREIFITKDEWRAKVLPGTIKSHWDNPGQLYGIIISSLNDGFFADVLEAAEHLHRTDPIPGRGACVYGIVLMKNNRLDEAERVLRSYLETHGEDGVVLTNLAKVFAARNDKTQAEETLWRALQFDPNQENGFNWYLAMHFDRSGQEAGLEAIRRVAALPHSWRAQLWLASVALESGDLSSALALYREGLGRAGNLVPADFLMQMSGDLGKNGHLRQLVDATEPHFAPRTHGVLVGNNLIKAHLELGEPEAARKILDELKAMNRPDWTPQLSFWETEILKAQ